MPLACLLFLLLVHVHAREYMRPHRLFTKNDILEIPQGDYRLRVLVIGGGDTGTRCDHPECPGGVPGEAKVIVIAVSGPVRIDIIVGKGAKVPEREYAQSSRFGVHAIAVGGKVGINYDDRYFSVFKRNKVFREINNSTSKYNGGSGVSIFSLQRPCAGNASDVSDDVTGRGGCGYGAGGGSIYSKDQETRGGSGADGVVYIEFANRACLSRTDLVFSFINRPATTKNYFKNQLQFVSSVSKSFLTSFSNTHIGLLINEEQPMRINLNSDPMLTSSSLELILKENINFDLERIADQLLTAEMQYKHHLNAHKNVTFSKILVLITKTDILQQLIKKSIFDFKRLPAQEIKIIIMGIGDKSKIQDFDKLAVDSCDVIVSPTSGNLKKFAEFVADVACLEPTESSQKPWSEKTLEELRQELMNFLNQSFEELDLGNQKLLQNVVDTGRHLLKENTRLKNVTKGSPGLQIVDVLFRFGSAIANKLETYLSDKMQTLSLISFDNSVVMTAATLDPIYFPGKSFPEIPVENSVKESIFFQPSVFSGRKGVSKVVSMVYDSFDDLEATESGSSLLSQRIIASEVTPPIKPPFNNPVVLTFKNNAAVIKANQGPSCVYWVSNNNPDPPFGKWVQNGCWLSPLTNVTHTVCLCDHLTNFAVLMQVQNVKISRHHLKVLTIITYFGCTVSAIGCALTIIVFILLQSLRSERILIHLNLAIALGLAQVVFSLGSLAHSNKGACLFVTILLYYLFMSVFTWMLVEGIHIYFMVIKVFEAERKRKGVYFGIGWGVSAVLTVATSAGYRDKLMADHFCWLSVSSGAIWTFVGPALFIILINFIVLMMVLKVTANAYGNASVFKDIRAVFKAFLTLVPLLGTTWVLGVLAINFETLVFQYLFCILGSLQGLFIFLLYCVGSSEVRRELKRKWNNWDAQRQISMSSQQKNKIQLDQSRPLKIGDNLQPGHNKQTREAKIKTKSSGSVTTTVFFKSRGSTATNNVLFNV